MKTVRISNNTLKRIVCESVKQFLFESNFSQIDLEYMDAVNRGDMKTAQRMVIKAAKMAMPNTKVVDENGNPLVVYHGTGSNFNVFKRGDIGFHFGTSEQAEVAAKNERNPRYIHAYLNIRNPYKIDFDPEEWDVPYNNFMRRLYDDGIIERDEMDSLIMATNSSYRNMKKVRERLLEHGYDGIIYPNWFEFNAGKERRTEFDDSYIALYPSQIKSADPVTYDDQGNVIPLSERFNINNNDIRYEE